MPHYCEHPNCWCKLDHSADLGEILFELIKIKDRLDEATEAMYKVVGLVDKKKEKPVPTKKKELSSEPTKT